MYANTTYIFDPRGNADMDTGSHVLFGATLAGFAMTDPALSSRPELLPFVLSALVVCSHAPDFDTIVRLKSKGAYVRWHRGITHAVPAWPLWPLVGALPFAALPGVDASVAWHMYAWCLAAVAFHVALDALNGYGVQLLRPFSRKWVHLDVLTIWDPFLFALHLGTFAGWAAGAWSPNPAFLLLYGATFAYIGFRMWRHRRRVRALRESLRPVGVCYVMPCLHWWKWSFVAELEDRYVSGFIRYGRIEDVSELEKGGPAESDPLVEASRQSESARAFLAFASRVHVTVGETGDGYVVRFRDMRFRYGQTMPFGADVTLDRARRVVRDRIGWSKKAWEGPYV